VLSTALNNWQPVYCCGWKINSRLRTVFVL